MRSEFFLDTVVLIYAALGRHEYPQHWEVAHEILSTGRNGISAQVLSEFYVNTTEAELLSISTAFEWLRRLAMMPVVGADADLVFQGVTYAERYGIPYWHAASVAAAERLGAETLYTDILEHGQLYGSVRVINPFPDR